MSDANVSVGFVGDSKSAEYAIARLQQQVADLQEKMKRGSATTSKAMSSDMVRLQRTNAAALQGGQSQWDGMSSSVGGYIMQLGVAAIAARSLGNVIGGIADKNKQLADSISKIGEVRAEEDLKLMIQGGFTPQQVEKQMPALRQAAMDMPAISDYAQLVQLQTQLASSSFKSGDVASGAAAREFLGISAATNQFGKSVGDPKQALMSVAMFAKSQGIAEPGAEDLHRIGGGLTRLFATSDIQFPDLQQLAKEGAALTGFGMSEQQQLGAFSMLRDQLGAEGGAVGLRNVVSRLGTAGASQDRVGALESIGLKPEDVAIAKGGKNLPEVLGRLQGALAGVSEEQKNQVLTKLFEIQGLPAAQTLLSNPQLLEKRISEAGDVQAFEASTQKFAASRFAEAQQDKIRKQFAERGIDTATGERTWAEIDLEQARRFAERREDVARGAPGVGRAFGQSALSAEEYFSSTMNWFYQKSGFQPADVPGGPSGASQQGTQMVGVLLSIDSNMKQQVRLQEENNKRARNRNGNVETVGAN